MLAETGLEDETILWADSQLAGRGQQGAKWQSQAGLSLTFSLFRRFDRFPARHPFYLNLAISLGVKQALDDLGVKQVSIKWPNDILSYSRKLCGILVENQIEKDRLASSIIGIGLNVNETEFEGLPRATSMRLDCGQKYDREEVLHLVSRKVFEVIRNLDRQSLAAIQAAYQDSLFRINVVSTFEDTKGATFSGIIRGVSQEGRLLVEEQSGDLRAYQPKEIALKY